MLFIKFFSEMIIPLIVLIVVLNGLLSKINIYEIFIKGAKDGAITVMKIFPTLVGLMIAVGIMRNSTLLDAISGSIGMLSQKVLIPGDIVPVIIVKMFSASATTGLILDIFKEYGTDSYIGIMASLLMCCSETLFYTVSMYYMEINVKKTRWTIAGALFSILIGIVICVVISNLCR